MASNQTENYQLSQWQASDQVLRTDFNQDNAKLDAAIKAADDKAEAAQTTAQAAYSPENSPVASGYYIGDGTEQRMINLGFTPRAVLVMTETSSMGNYGGLAVTGRHAAFDSYYAAEWVLGYTRVAITEGGFLVSYYKINDSVGVKTNTNGTYYLYVAFR